MPITVEIRNKSADEEAFEMIFAYFRYVDEKFSTYKETSEVMRMNRGEITKDECTEDMKTVLALSEETKKDSNGYFDIMQRGICDPSGLVKGWAINNAAILLDQRGFSDFFIDVGGDIQTRSAEDTPQYWSIGIKNPLNTEEIIKVVYLKNEGIATSGTSARGQHIYNPKAEAAPINDIKSITVIGPNVYEADRFATAAFAMGKQGIAFIETLPGLEGYMVQSDGTALLSSGFNKFITPPCLP